VVETRTALTELLAVPLVLHPTSSVMPAAFDIACEKGRTAYDSIYLAPARAQGCQFVNADQRFYNAMQSTPYAVAMLRIEDVRETIASSRATPP
jgi:predicted nucleic acid-binding protein